MVENHFIFNVIIYAIVIGYILYINFAAYYNKTTGFLNGLISLFQNWIFRIVFLLIIGFFALDLFPYGGFILAVLLTIAFLNTNMLLYKRDLSENFTSNSESGTDTDYVPYQSDGYNEDANENDDNDEDGVEPYANSNNYEDDNEEKLEEIYNEMAETGNEGDEDDEDYGDDDEVDTFANMDEYAESPKNCGPYAPIQRLPFNPQGFRPNESVMAYGWPDKIASDSAGPSEYTTSGNGYDFDMA